MSFYKYDIEATNKILSTQYNFIHFQNAQINKIVQIKNLWHLQTRMIVLPKRKDKSQNSCIKELPRPRVTRVCVVCLVCMCSQLQWTSRNTER